MSSLYFYWCHAISCQQTVLSHVMLFPVSRLVYIAGVVYTRWICYYFPRVVITDALLFPVSRLGYHRCHVISCKQTVLSQICPAISCKQTRLSQMSCYFLSADSAITDTSVGRLHSMLWQLPYYFLSADFAHRDVLQFPVSRLCYHRCHAISWISCQQTMLLQIQTLLL